MLWRIESSYFVAGVIVVDGIVTIAAPILHWMRGKRWADVKRYCINKGWHGQPIKTTNK